MNKQQLLSRVNPGKSGKQKSLKMLVFQAFVMNYNDSGGERDLSRSLNPFTIKPFGGYQKFTHRNTHQLF